MRFGAAGLSQLRDKALIQPAAPARNASQSRADGRRRQEQLAGRRAVGSRTPASGGPIRRARSIPIVDAAASQVAELAEVA